MVNIDDCVNNFCYYNVICLDFVNSYNCICLIGYTGKDCYVVINNCVNLFCLNGGICINRFDG